jgi:hypothetical protein
MCFGSKGSSKPPPAPVPIVQNPDENTYRGGPERVAPPVPPIGGLPQSASDTGASFGASLGNSTMVK